MMQKMMPQVALATPRGPCHLDAHHLHYWEAALVQNREKARGLFTSGPP